MYAAIHSDPIYQSASSSQPSSTSAKPYRRDIDGLRAIAVTSVVVYHAGLHLFSGGFVGVDVFLVISGYLIGSHVYSEVRCRRFRIGEFYRRRAKRILPALFAVLLFCYLVSVFLLDGKELKALAEYIVATVGSASNVLVWLKVNYFSPGANQNPLLMTWSLGVEEQFYLIFPLLMFFFGRMGRRKLFTATAIVLLLSFLLSVLGVTRYPTATFYLLPTRAWEISVGILLSVYEVDRPSAEVYAAGRFASWLGLLGLAVLIYAVVSYNGNTPFPGFAAALPVVGSALILASPSGWVNRYLLSRKPLVFLGQISYSWYLWHWPLLSFARIVSGRDLSTSTSSAIAVFSLGVAWCSYRFVEQPFRRTTTPVRPLLLKYGVLCLLMLVPALILVLFQGWPSRFPALSALEARSGVQSANDRCLVEYGMASLNLSPFCVPQNDEREGVALMGDSHAAALGEALRLLAQGENLEFYQLTKGSCPPLSGVTRRMPNHPGHDRECASFNRKAMDLVRSDPRIRTVWLAAYWSAPFVEQASGSRYVLTGQSSSVSPAESKINFKIGLVATIDALRSAGKRVVIVKDNPQFQFDPVQRVRADFAPFRSALRAILVPSGNDNSSASRQEILTPEDALASSIIDQIARSPDRIFDLKSNLCNDQSCFFYKDNLLLYNDQQHLSLAGARRALIGVQVTGFPSAIMRIPGVNGHSPSPKLKLLSSF